MNKPLLDTYAATLRAEKQVIDDHYAKMRAQSLDMFVLPKTLNGIYKVYGSKVSKLVTSKLESLTEWSKEIGDETKFKISPKDAKLRTDDALKWSYTKVSTDVLLQVLEEVSDLLYEELESLKL